MKKNKNLLEKTETSFLRAEPDPQQGLRSDQVADRIAAGAVNRQEDGLTPTVGSIIKKNTLTLFNLINLFLAVTIVLVGHPENTLFFGIAICNTLMGIIQELRAKKTLDKLSVLAKSRVHAVRDGKNQYIDQQEIVLDDIVFVRAGDQILADAQVVVSEGLELDESLLTGESDRVLKNTSDIVLSGSFVTAGQGFLRVTAVGKDNYAVALTEEAKQEKKERSKLLQTLKTIIRVLTVVIIPLGLLLFYASYSRGEGLAPSVLGAAAAMTGMIPGGLVLLTSVTLTVGAMNLAKKRALVQSLSSIETLARVDVLCLDKTGTITDGNLVFEETILFEQEDEKKIHRAISELMGALPDENATAVCLRSAFGAQMRWNMTDAVPFSSDRKWSGASFKGECSYLLGSPGILFKENTTVLGEVEQYVNEGYRVLCLAHTNEKTLTYETPDNLRCEALLLLSDNIREDAIETFRYLADEGVTLKVISGDNPKTVSIVAKKAEIAGAEKYIDMSRFHQEDYTQITEEYTVFGHVSPQQKKKLIAAMQKNGHTACMTGDGVNDILAMREADCSVAMAGGSAAARNACDFVLISPTFGAMKGVLREGRRVINNIEKVASLYLVNTVFSVIFAILYTFLPLAYPYAPIQMTPINAFTVGIPSFFLALQPNYNKPEGKLVSNIFEHSFPAAFTIVFNTLYLQLAGILFHLEAEELSTMVVFLVGIVGFFLLLRISQPYTTPVKVMLITLFTGFVLLFTVFGQYFSLGSLFTRNAFFYLPLMYFSYHVHDFLGKLSHRAVSAYQNHLAKKRGEPA